MLDVGKRFGMLTVLERLPNSKFRCKCDCGNEKTFYVGHLNAGYFKTCGCHVVRHGHHKGKKRSREYITYYNMLDRCLKPSNKRYMDYGGKGITVCDRWKESFINFIEDMGNCPEGMQIDRIDNTKGYSPENCRWVTPKENMANRSVSKKYIINGEVFDSSIDAAKKLKVSGQTILAWCKGRFVKDKFYPPKQNCFCQ